MNCAQAQTLLEGAANGSWPAALAILGLCVVGVAAVIGFVFILWSKA